MDYRAYHFVEPGLSRVIDSAIASLSKRAWTLLVAPDECLDGVHVWQELLRETHIESEWLGAVMHPDYSGSGGYRLTDGSLLDHHYLAVGPALALFDPTGWQKTIRDDGGPSLERYVTSSPGGVDVTFLRWRSARLAAT